MAEAPTRDHLRLRDRMFHRLRLGGLVLALVFFWEALNPTLLPRSGAVQALLCGGLAAIGYGLGASASVLVGWALTARGRGPVPTRWARRVVWVLWLVALVAGAVVWPDWQNAQRDLVAMPHVAGAAYVVVLVAGAVIFVVFLAIGRLVGQGLVALHRHLARVIDRRIAFATVLALCVAFGPTLAQDFLFQPLVNSVNSSYADVDSTTTPGTHRPTTGLQSGGPGSLVSWRSLGMTGRNFAGNAPTPEELATVVAPGTPVEEPIRVYVGLRSAPDARARARLAVRELERTGAFQRRVLVVATATGTGWINPFAARAFEAINGGDTAIVTIQYSYLPSWISFLVDQDKAAEAGVELYRAVHRRWLEEPAATRPRLVAFGESLGSFGSEHAFDAGSPAASLREVVRGVDAALWVGPTLSNPVRTPLIGIRASGTPTWRPVVDGGRQVTFQNSPDELLKVAGTPVVYEQHASDPVGWWGWSSAWSVPLWLQGPRGYDVPDRAHWFPIVTWGQTAADLIAGFSAPAGHGHNYNDGWAQAVAAVAAPPGWTAADTREIAPRLEHFVIGPE